MTAAHTLCAPARHAIEVKRSRFLAQAAPVEDIDAALAFVRAAGDPGATHNAWAYRIGAAYRCSDDGEPSGTAGRPVLAAIDAQGLDRIAVVVTRWYGGIKLGAGGLARAYGGAAAECLRAAPRRALIAYVDRTLTCPFADLGSVHALLAAHGATRLDDAFDAEGARLRLGVPAASLPALEIALRDATRDRLRWVEPPEP